MTRHYYSLNVLPFISHDTLGELHLVTIRTGLYWCHTACQGSVTDKVDSRNASHWSLFNDVFVYLTLFNPSPPSGKCFAGLFFQMN